MAAMQCTLRQDIEAHKYGSSPANQRIESWWAVYQRNRSSWWIDFFKNLIEQDSFSPGNELQQERIWFCFNKLVQDDLDAVKDHWNSHRIRHSRHDTVSGRPDELFFLLEHHGDADNLLCNVCKKRSLYNKSTLNTLWQTHSWKCQTLARKEFSCTKLYWILLE